MERILETGVPNIYTIEKKGIKKLIYQAPWRKDDEIAGLVGGLGMAPGANIGEHAAIFEAVHGSAPDIAGKGIANPTALLLAAAMMLDHVKRADLGDRLRRAIDETLNIDNVRTGDLGGTANTREFTAALVKRAKAGV
jgi:isocitrate dehydrogenase (NAD+)